MSNRFGVVLDLLVVLALLGAAGAAVVLPLTGPLRVVLVLPTVLFLPGYALVSFLYPDLPRDPEGRNDEGWSLNGLERAGLALVASVAIVPTVALVLNFTSYGIYAKPLLAATAGVTALLTLGALGRRFMLEPERRFRVPPGRLVGGGLRRYLSAGGRRTRESLPFEARTNGQRLLNLLLAAAIVVLLSSVAYAAVGPTLPDDDSTSTEFYLLDDSGEYLLGTEAPVGGDGSVPFTIAIANNENVETTYTVVIQRQQLGGPNGTQVQSRSTVESFEATVGTVGNATFSRSVEAGGENVRYAVLLYRGDAVSDPTAENAYRATRFWTTGGTAA